MNENKLSKHIVVDLVLKNGKRKQGRREYPMRYFITPKYQNITFYWLGFQMTETLWPLAEIELKA